MINEEPPSTIGYFLMAFCGGAIMTGVVFVIKMVFFDTWSN